MYIQIMYIHVFTRNKKACYVSSFINTPEDAKDATIQLAPIHCLFC